MTTDDVPPDGNPPDRDARGVPWFERLFDTHGAAVRAYARRRVGEDADDVVAEVFTTAWLKRDTVPERALPWLYRTAAHHALHSRRTVARQVRTTDAVAGQVGVAQGDPIDEVVSSLDDRAAVAAAMSRLGTSDGELLRLWAWEQLDVRDIAYVLRIGSGTARVRLHRARRRLRAALDDVAEKRGDEGPRIDQVSRLDPMPRVHPGRTADRVAAPALRRTVAVLATPHREEHA